MLGKDTILVDGIAGPLAEASDTTVTSGTMVEGAGVASCANWVARTRAIVDSSCSSDIWSTVGTAALESLGRGDVLEGFARALGSEAGGGLLDRLEGVVRPFALLGGETIVWGWERGAKNDVMVGCDNAVSLDAGVDMDGAVVTSLPDARGTTLSERSAACALSPAFWNR